MTLICVDFFPFLFGLSRQNNRGLHLVIFFFLCPLATLSMKTAILRVLVLPRRYLGATGVKRTEVSTYRLL